MKSETFGMLMILITVVLWSTIEVVSKVVGNDLPAMTIAFIRFTTGGLFLLPLSVIGIKNGALRNMTPRDWISLVLLSALGITLTFSLYHKALLWISATSVATLVSMVPILAAPVAFFVLDEKIGIIQIVGLMLGGAGIFLIYFAEEPNWRSIVGVLIMVMAVVCFSIYAVLMKRLNLKMTARVSTPLSLFIGGLLMAPITLIEGSPLFRPLDLNGYLLMGWLSFAAVGVAYLLYFIGLERLKVAKGNSLMYLKPLIAGFLAWLIIDELLTAARIASAVLISVSIYFVLKGPAFMRSVSREEKTKP